MLSEKMIIDAENLYKEYRRKVDRGRLPSVDVSDLIPELIYEIKDLQEQLNNTHQQLSHTQAQLLDLKSKYNL